MRISVAKTKNAVILKFVKQSWAKGHGFFIKNPKWVAYAFK
jgi:hypothetical protein